MENYSKLIGMLSRQENFAFSRFNDGEMMGVNKVGSLVARGDQVVNNVLHDKLIKVLKHSQHNYWKGKPCNVCYPQHRKLYEEYVNVNYQYQTHAVVFCNNGHWKNFIKDFEANHFNRPIYWIGGVDQNLDKLKDYNIIEKIDLPKKDAWSKYNEIKDNVSNFKSNSIVVLCCGPMSRVLSCEWFQERQDCTFLDLGSTFDPITRNIYLKCHKGKVKYCSECNFKK